MNIEKAIAELQKSDPGHRDILTLSVLAEMGNRSLYFLSKYILGYNAITRRTHDPIIKCLESESKRKLICVPRGTFKSTIAVIAYSIFRILQNPNIRILIDSELFTNSSRFLREVKGHLQSELFISLYGDYKAKQTWNDSEIIISKRTKQYKEATITCSGIGAGKTGQHYDLIIGDDYNSAQNSNSTDNKLKIIEHYRLNQSILEPFGEYVVIGTRYAEDDLIGFILKNEIAEPEDRSITF